MLEGTWLTFPCSTKEKNLSTSLLKAVIFISPWWPKNSMKQNITTWKHTDVHQQTGMIALDSNTHAFIYYLKGEELSFSSRVAPVADTRLVHDSGSDGPSRREDTCDNNFAPKQQVCKTKQCCRALNLCSRWTTFMQLKPNYSLPFILINTRIIV